MGATVHVQIVRSFEHHPRMHAQVRIRTPHWIPKFLRSLWLLIDSCAEKQGVVIHMERDTYREEILYTVRFENSGSRTDRNYFEAELEFLTEKVDKP